MRFLVGLIVLTSCATAQAPRVPNPEPLTDRQIFRAGLDSLVQIAVVHGDGEGYSVAYGSGSFVGRGENTQMVILTAAHLFMQEDDPYQAHIVVRVSEDVPFGTPSKQSQAWLLKYDRKADLALVSIVKDIPRTRLVLGAPLKQLDPCWTVGNPSETPTTVSRCIVDRVNYYGKADHKLGQMTGLAWPGWSGGPVLNDRAELVGVITAVDAVHDPTVDDEDKRVIVEDIAFYVQADAIAKILKAGKVQ